MKLFCIFFLLCLFYITGVAQQIPVEEKPDTAKMYKDIAKFSKKSGFTKLIYKLVFKSMNVSSTKKKKDKATAQLFYKPFEGKIIRSINIITLDPFGYNIRDTNVVPQGWIVKTENVLHVKTLHITIRNLLLFKKNDVYDSLKVRESERLIRSQRYIREVFLYTTQPSKKSDSVDVYIRVLDLWSILPDVASSTTRSSFKLTERNFLGTGHQFKNNYNWRFSTGKRAFGSSYFIPSIKNSYVNVGLQYNIDEENNFSKSININRPLFSPLAKWAGGFYLGQQFYISESFVNDTVQLLPFKYNTLDYWGAKSWQVLKGGTEQARFTNLIASARMLRIKYVQSPPESIDSLLIYNDELFFLTGIGITTRKFVEDKYIFKFGETEDIPTGNAYGIVSGYQIKNNTGRIYLGLRLAHGDYNKFGYTSTNLEYGTFLNSSQPEQGLIKAEVNYFSNMFNWGRWKFRQFVQPEITIGLLRLPYESITINDDVGIGGFVSPSLAGTSRFLLRLQTQSYAPWNLIGFRFGPYLLSSFALVGDNAQGLKKSKLYSQFGIGVLVKNDFLVLNSFQFSVSFYPIIPGVGNTILKVNQFKSSDINFIDFNLDKPFTSVFQ